MRDEAAELPGLFRATEALEQFDGGTVSVCLMLDGCTDNSAALVDAYRARSRHQVRVGATPKSPSNAGSARRRAMELGLEAIDPDHGLLLTTDADSRPAPDWLSRMTAALVCADIVAGRIIRSNTAGASALQAGPLQASPLQDRIERYYDALFALRRRLDPVPWEARDTHHFTGGANMGFRAAAYRAIGGFQPLASGEDARLVDDASRAGMRVRRDGNCVVYTSARREGRAPAGLALALRRCDESSASATYIAHPDDAAWQYRLHALAREAFLHGRWDAIGEATGLGHDHVLGVARDCPNEEAFAMRVVPSPPNGTRTVTLTEAEAALAMLDQERTAA